MNELSLMDVSMSGRISIHSYSKIVFCVGGAVVHPVARVIRVNISMAYINNTKVMQKVFVLIIPPF